jgi:hypothetical protein
MSEAFGIGAALRRLTPGRPLVIVDADEVVLRFVDGFDKFLRSRSLFLDLTSYRLHGNVKRLEDKSALLDVEVTALLDEFRADIDSLEAVEGACETLANLAPHADIVVLSNVSPSQAVARARNLEAIGLNVPLIANEGTKGAAVKALTSRAGTPSFFVDDIPRHLESAAEAAPSVYRIHLIGDDRLKPLLPAASHAHLRAENWREAGEFMQARLEGS